MSPSSPRPRASRLSGNLVILGHFEPIRPLHDTEPHREHFITTMTEIRDDLLTFRAGSNLYLTYPKLIGPLIAYAEAHDLVGEEDRGYGALATAKRRLSEVKRDDDFVEINRRLLVRLLDATITHAQAIEFEDAVAVTKEEAAAIYPQLCAYVAEELRAADYPDSEALSAALSAFDACEDDAFCELNGLKMGSRGGPGVELPPSLTDLWSVLKGYGMTMAGKRPYSIDPGLRPWMIKRAQDILTTVDAKLTAAPGARM